MALEMVEIVLGKCQMKIILKLYQYYIVLYLILYRIVEILPLVFDLY